MDKYQLVGFAINFLVIFGNLMTYAIIGRVLVSWFTMGRPGQQGPISRVLIEVTEPVIRIAKKIPHKIGMIDLSPIIALIGIDLIIRVIVILLNKLLV